MKECVQFGHMERENNMTSKQEVHSLSDKEK